MKAIPLKPTPAMIEAGAQRLANWQDDSQWPGHWTYPQIHQFRNDAERIWRSMWLASQETMFVKYEMMFVDEPWSLNYVVYKNFMFNGSNETVISMLRKHCIATFVYEEDARKYCELREAE